MVEKQENIKKKLSKIEKKEFLKREKQKIINFSSKLKKHTERNRNTKHINHKIFYLLHDPFTLVNAYTKISKNKGALTEGHDDDKSMELFGLTKASRIANKLKRGEYKFKPVKRTWIPKPGKKKKKTY